MSDEETPTKSEGDPAPRAARWAAAAVVAVHAALVTRIVPLSLALSADPAVGTDYSLHSTRAIEAAEHFVPSGRLWGYDPFHSAGMITGTVTDLDNKLAEVVTGLIGPLFGYGRAFNLFLFLAFALIPVAYFAAARALRLRPWAVVAAMALASAAFHFDAYVANWTLFGGYGFIHASVVAPVIVAALARQVESPSVRSALWLAATAPLFYTHALTPLLVAVIGLPLVPQALRSGGRALGLTIAAVATIVVLNLPWIGPMIGDWHTISPTPGRVHAFGTPLAELLDYLASGRVYGVLLPLVLGVAGAVLLARSGRRSVAAAFGLGGLVILIAAFEGQRSAAIRAMVEAPRLKVTFPFVMALPAAYALERLTPLATKNGRWNLALPALLLVAVVFRGAVVMPVATRVFGKARVRNALAPGADTLFDALRGLGDTRGRIALEEIGPLDGGKPPFDAYVAAVGPGRTGRAWIGGPYYRGWTGHKVASFVNGKLCETPLDELTDDEIAARFERYDVTGVAAVQPASIARLRSADAVLEEVGEAAPYVLFRVLRDAAPTRDGRAEVDYAVDRIDVRPADTEDVVLKLHFDRRLVVPEPLVLTREEIEGDAVGFIRVSGHGGRPFAISVD